MLLKIFKLEVNSLATIISFLATSTSIPTIAASRTKFTTSAILTTASISTATSISTTTSI